MKNRKEKKQPEILEKQTEPEILEEKEQEIKLESGANSKKEDLEEIEKLKKENEKLKSENNSLLDKIKLSQAELINYRKRKDDEVQGLLKFANQDLISELIPLVDNFERAIISAKKSNNQEIAKYLSGFEMMYQSLITILNKFGVEEINRIGEVFDPKQEEAIVSDHVEDKEDEVVLEVLQKGYKLKDRVIRPAKVKINQK